MHQRSTGVPSGVFFTLNPVRLPSLSLDDERLHTHAIRLSIRPRHGLRAVGPALRRWP